MDKNQGVRAAQRKLTSQAFTLIELLVVISIIASHFGGNNRLFTGTGCDDSFYNE